MLYLGLDHDGSRVEGWLVDASGRMLARSLASTLEEALAPCVAAQRNRPTVVLAAVAPGVDLPLPTCPRDQALFAGALGGGAGLLVDGSELARVLALDRSGRLQTFPREPGEVGLEPLRERVELMAGDEATTVSRRLRERMGRDQGLLEAAYELASWPGPDPDLRGLFLAQARRLVEVARLAHSRLLPGGSLRGSWSGDLMRPPLLELFQQEVFRHLPEVRWRPPLLPAVAGAVLLARAGGPAARVDPLRSLLRQRPGWNGFVTELLDAVV